MRLGSSLQPLCSRGRGRPSRPGELVDVVVTERGIAINPRRKDLLRAAQGKGLPIRTFEEIRREVLTLCGGPPEPPRVDTTHPIAVVKWVDGTLLDTVFKVGESPRRA
jgi:citrate lyase subunit alpha / citrate CoA-transferase